MLRIQKQKAGIKGSALPTKRKLTHARGPKQKQPNEDIDQLKDKLGIDNLNRDIVVSLTATFQKHIAGPKPSTLSYSSNNLKTERYVNRSRGNVSMTLNRNRPGGENNEERVQVPASRLDLISWVDHDVGSNQIHSYNFNGFSIDYLSDSYTLSLGFITPPTVGANTADAFQKAFDQPNSEIDKGEVFEEYLEDTEWNIPKLKTE
ncbi:unnamed protein product [Mytilus coruscus]|uniref:Uncharacterized protein n=1 Tax=Mytilus coruscus TaxID=42192 RepID=A0A6J8C4Y5_MYTCO|nr:unnamed protein product [Mytilus coruscus]